MTFRSQTVALVVFFAALVAVFLLVGNAGVTTGISLPGSQAEAGPQPEDDAAQVEVRWAEDELQPGSYRYIADPDVQATIAYQETSYTELATQLGVLVPGEDVGMPAFDILRQYRLAFEALLPTMPPGDPIVFDGPEVKLFDLVTVATARLTVKPNVNPNVPAGIVVGFALVEKDDTTAYLFEYQQIGAANEAIYAEFETWLEANVAEITAPAEEEGDADEAAEPDAEDTADAPQDDTDAAQEDGAVDEDAADSPGAPDETGDAGDDAPAAEDTETTTE